MKFSESSIFYYLEHRLLLFHYAYCWSFEHVYWQETEAQWIFYHSQFFSKKTTGWDLRWWRGFCSCIVWYGLRTNFWTNCWKIIWRHVEGKMTSGSRFCSKQWPHTLSHALKTWLCTKLLATQTFKRCVHLFFSEMKSWGHYKQRTVYQLSYLQ